MKSCKLIHVASHFLVRVCMWRVLWNSEWTGFQLCWFGRLEISNWIQNSLQAMNSIDSYFFFYILVQLLKSKQQELIKYLEIWKYRDKADKDLLIQLILIDIYKNCFKKSKIEKWSIHNISILSKQTNGYSEQMLFNMCLELVSTIFFFSPCDSPSKTTKNAFYIILEALFVLFVIFSFLSTLSIYERTNDVINWFA